MYDDLATAAHVKAFDSEVCGHNHVGNGLHVGSFLVLKLAVYSCIELVGQAPAIPPPPVPAVQAQVPLHARVMKRARGYAVVFKDLQVNELFETELYGAHLSF